MVQKNPITSLSPVIVIDADEFFRVAMDAVLSEWFGDTGVVTCATAQEGMDQMATGTRFGLGLVDLNMPGIDKSALLQALKAAQPDLRLVVMSASRSREDILRALAEGAHGFISKGLGIGEAESAIQQIADGAVYVPPFTPRSDVAAPCQGAAGKPPPVSLRALTPRQREVLRLLVAGQPNKGIARALGINLSTVKFHLSFIYQGLGVSNRVEAATLGARLLEEDE